LQRAIRIFRKYLKQQEQTSRSIRMIRELALQIFPYFSVTPTSIRITATVHACHLISLFVLIFSAM